MITKFVLKNLHCDACGKLSLMKMRKIPGLHTVRIEQEGREAQGELESEREVNIAEIQKALSDTVYTVELVPQV
jgi:hypothetical protein